MKTILIGLLTLVLLASCSTPPAQTPVSTATASSSLQSVDIQNCQPSSYITPVLPEKIPKWNELDESVGLHVTGKYQIIDPESYRLKISGMVDNPLELTYDQIRCLPKVTANPRLVCPRVFVDNATWGGVSFKTVMDLAGVQDGAKELILTSVDGYRTNINLEDALQLNGLLAYEVNGQTLPILHGFPIRAVFPFQDGGKWIKWLVEIEVK